MMNVTLSVIIPMYNGKEFIVDTVNSILPIKVSKEILIIDDGSTDDSYHFCVETFQNYHEVKVIHKENGGIVDARNFALQNAQGSYIAFSDHDDMVCADVIDKAVSIAEENDLDLVMWSTERWLSDGNTEACDCVIEEGLYTENDIQEFFVKDMLMNIGNRKISYIGHLWSGLYKKSIIDNEEITFKRFVDYEDDYLFVFDYIRGCKRIALIKSVGYYWRYNLKSETYRQKYITDMLQKYMSFYEYVGQGIESIKYDDIFFEKYQTFIIQDVMVRLVENCCTILNSAKSDVQILKKYYHNNRAAFVNGSIYPYTKRRKRIFKCLSWGTFEVAELYVYLDSIYRYLRRNMK